MSFLVRSDAPVLGPSVAVELDNILTTSGSASGLGAVAAGNVGKVQREEYIVLNLSATSTSQTVFISDDNYQICSVYFIFGTASSSGTLNVEVASDGQAVGGGTSALASAANLTGTVNTKQSATLNSSVSSLKVAQGQHVNIILGGTLTGLANAQVTIGLIRI